LTANDVNQDSGEQKMANHNHNTNHHNHDRGRAKTRHRGHRKAYNRNNNHDKSTPGAEAPKSEMQSSNNDC